MAKGPSKSAARTLEGQEVAGEYWRAVPSGCCRVFATPAPPFPSRCAVVHGVVLTRRRGRFPLRLAPAFRLFRWKLHLRYDVEEEPQVATRTEGRNRCV